MSNDFSGIVSELISIRKLYLSRERNYYKALDLDTRLEGVDQYMSVYSPTLFVLSSVSFIAHLTSPIFATRSLAFIPISPSPF